MLLCRSFLQDLVDLKVKIPGGGIDTHSLSGDIQGSPESESLPQVVRELRRARGTALNTLCRQSVPFRRPETRDGSK